MSAIDTEAIAELVRTWRSRARTLDRIARSEPTDNLRPQPGRAAVKAGVYRYVAVELEALYLQPRPEGSES